MNNLEKFLECYKKHLTEQVHKDPQTYYWYPITSIDTVFERMKRAIINGSFNKDSQSFKNVCKELGIKHTYKDIAGYIKS